MPAKNIFLNKDDQPSFAQFAVRILPKLALLCITTIITSPLWLVYWLGCSIWYRPPNVPYLQQTLRYLKHIWTVSPTNPSLPIFGRIWLTISILHFYVTAPVHGIAWLLDELLYGNALNAISVTSPFFVISAGRSGSTQITRYLEEDQRLVAPTILQCMFPYLWLWKIAPHTIGRLIKPNRVQEMIQSVMPKELWERHEADPFKADTFDGAFLSFHLHRFSLYLGPEIAKEDFNLASIAPYDVQIKEKDFVRLVDRLARKSLLFARVSPTAETRRFYLKGHFLFGAQALSEQYPDAFFLTVIREPLSRLQSGINYLRVNPPDPVLGPVPWSWLTDTLRHTEAFYNKAEQAWFKKNANGRRSVIKFTDFTNDLEASIKKVYQDCFQTDEVPAHIPKKHPPRERQHYTVNRTLAELGVDEVALQNELKEYIEWCQPLKG